VLELVCRLAPLVEIQQLADGNVETMNVTLMARRPGARDRYRTGGDGTERAPLPRILPCERFPNLLELADHFAVNDPDARFELLLDLFVDGLAKRATDPGGD
jgi:hypothetical protein